MLFRTAYRTIGLLSKSRLRGSCIFLVSALAVAFLISACDNGSATSDPSSPTVVAGAATAPAQVGGTAIERGKVIFGRYCNTCHPGGGRGAGPSILREATSAPDDQIMSIVRNGKNRMPPFGAATISDDDLADLIAYMRTFQVQQ